MAAPVRREKPAALAAAGFCFIWGAEIFISPVDFCFQYLHLQNSYKSVTIFTVLARQILLRKVSKMENPMKKLFFLLMAASLLTTAASAAGISHTVAKGDTMWKLAVKYEVGTSEIIAANPQVSNPDLIYPGQVLNIPQIDASVLAFESEVIRLVNEQRMQNGLKPLAANWELSRVARYKSQDMVDNRYFSHTSPTYGTPFQMMRSFGLSFRTAGENIAYGQRTPQAVVNGWMNSSGHRANILNASYTQIGVGYVANGHYWTQMFMG